MDLCGTRFAENCSQKIVEYKELKVMNQNSNLTRAPILVIAFNRAESTRKVLEALTLSNVHEIYFAVDGPRIGVIDDLARVSEVTSLVDEFKGRLKFKTLIRDTNLGCRLAVTDAITWFLSQEIFGIILEDDCVPSEEFLIFASRMLTLYQDQENIMHVGGSSYLRQDVDYPYNHYFSSFHEVWGWATWARAWKFFQLDPGLHTIEEDELILNHFKSKKIANWFMGYLIQVRAENPSVWSTQWSLSIIKNKGIAVNPIGNLVKNIGFSPDSTHGSDKSFRYYDTFSLTKLPLLPDPTILEINFNLDKKRFKVIQKTDPSLFIKNILKAKIRKLVLAYFPKKIILLIRKFKSTLKRK